MSYARKGKCRRDARDKVLPWILSEHSNSLKSRPQLGEDGIAFSPFAVKLYEINV